MARTLKGCFKNQFTLKVPDRWCLLSMLL